MKRISITAIIFLVGIIYSDHVKAQKAEAALAAFSSEYAAEKLYLHYDKEYYVAGETIWFKAYFYSNGKPSGISNNLYIQFIDSKGKVIADNRYPVMGAVAKGSIVIPDSVQQGNYYVRALTPGMLNFDESLIYKKNIFVFKPSAPRANGEINQNVSLLFFPESGNLVDGIEMITGFKATDQYGTPVEIKGVIKTDDGTTVTSFSSYHDGIGRVIFTPKAGKKYIAEVQTEAGPRSYPLPEVKLSGINLDVQDEKGAKKILLSRSEKDKAKFDNLLLVAEINNQVVFENEIAFEDYPSVTGKIGTETLPSGILHFTVFSKEGLPLAERLSFIDNGEYRTTASVNSTKFSSDKKSLNELEINFPEIMQRSLSIAVTAISNFSFGDNDNIYSRLLLTGDLKGYINNPAWYFENSNDSSRLALDNLMITQGWSRFNWEKILGGKLPEGKFSDQLFISVSGTVKDERNKEIFSGGKLNFFVEQDSVQTPYEVKIDANGKFTIDSLFISGKAKFFYAYTDAKDKPRSSIITLNSGVETFPPIIPQNAIENVSWKNTNSSQSKEEVNSRYGYAQSKFNEVKELEKVTVQSKTTKRPSEIVNEKYSSGVWRSGAKETLDNINEPANDKSLNVVDYIKNSIQQVEMQNGQFVNRKNVSLMSGRKWIVGIFIDQVPSSITQLRIMRVQDVALIKFFEAGFVGVGSEFPGGAIAVYTKGKEDAKPDKLNYFDYKGYTVTKEFYNPDYSTMPGGSSSITDSRTTLYWNPDSFTNTENASVKISFFNNDFSRKFKVVVEGFDANGKLVHIEKIIGK